MNRVLFKCLSLSRNLLSGLCLYHSLEVSFYDNSKGATSAKTIAIATASETIVHTRWIVNNVRKYFSTIAMLRPCGRDFVRTELRFVFLRAILHSLYLQRRSYCSSTDDNVLTSSGCVTYYFQFLVAIMALSVENGFCHVCWCYWRLLFEDHISGAQVL